MQWEDRIGRKLKLKDLHTLQVVGEVGSMAKASRLLGLSQPAISKAIAEMEQALGASLLERSAIGVELTASGHAIIERVRVVFDEVRQGVKDVAALADPTRGEVRIGATEPLTVVVAEAINHLVRQYPNITYSVVITDTTTLMRDLRERNIDVAVTRWTQTNAASDLQADLLDNNPLNVLAHKGHPLVRAKTLELQDLMDERWTLSPPDSFLGQMVGDLFRRQRLPYPAASVASVSIYMRLTLLASARYLTVLPASMLRHPADKSWLRALPVNLGTTPGHVAVITLKKRRSSGVVDLFRRACRDAMQ